MKCRVYGRVQGVWFRGSTRSQALKLGLRGYAMNLADGSVEVLACGLPPSLEVLINWLHRGPPSAQVERVECTAVTAAESRSVAGVEFDIR